MRVILTEIRPVKWFKGKAPRIKMKYLNQFELHNVLSDLDLECRINWDWLILLIAKTGLRFSEALGLTPADFNFVQQNLSVTKTWNYKEMVVFHLPKINLPCGKCRLIGSCYAISATHQRLTQDKPIFVNSSVCNSLNISSWSATAKCGCTSHFPIPGLDTHAPLF